MEDNGDEIQEEIIVERDVTVEKMIEKDLRSV